MEGRPRVSFPKFGEPGLQCINRASAAMKTHSFPLADFTVGRSGTPVQCYLYRAERQNTRPNLRAYLAASLSRLFCPLLMILFR